MHVLEVKGNGLNSSKYYIVDYTDLSIKEISYSDLEDLVEKHPDDFINCEMLATLFIDNEWTLTDNSFFQDEDADFYVSYTDIKLYDTWFKPFAQEVNPEENFDGYAERLTFNYDCSLIVRDNHIDDFCLIYFYRFEDYIVMRCRLALNYGDYNFITVVYSLNTKKFVDCISETLPDLKKDSNIEDDEDYLFMQIVHPEFSKYRDLNYVMFDY